jgi:hypothetical protein
VLYLEPRAVICELADAVECEVDDLLADGVVAAGVVVGGVLLAGDQLLGVEQLAVGAGAHLIDHSLNNGKKKKKRENRQEKRRNELEHNRETRKREAHRATGCGRVLFVVSTNGLEIDEDAARHVLSGTSLGEEGVEGIIASSDGLVRGHLSVGLDAVLEAVQLPARISDLDSGLSDVNGDNLTHVEKRRELGGGRRLKRMKRTREQRPDKCAAGGEKAVVSGGSRSFPLSSPPLRCIRAAAAAAAVVADELVVLVQRHRNSKF